MDAASARIVEGEICEQGDDAAGARTVEGTRLIIARPAGSARLQMLA